MEKPIITSDDLVDFDLDAYPIWTCTNRLRWDRSEVKITRQGFGLWHLSSRSKKGKKVKRIY